MILLTELSTRTESPRLLSDGQAVWRFTFVGNERYIDDHGVEFFWSGINNQIVDIRGVFVRDVSYLEVNDLATCRATEESFFWDDANKTLYVHYLNNANDYTIARSVVRLLESSAGYASGVFAGQPSYYPNLYFNPILQAIGQLAKRVDPLKFGLLSFQSSSYELDNANGALDSFSLSQAFNSLVRFVLMQRGQTDVDNGQRIFTGYTNGADRSDESLGVQLEEARVFFNRAVCPNVFTAADYPSIDNKFAGKPIPVAYGDVRRGIAVPIDTASFDKASGGAVTWKLADDTLHEIRSVTAIYDSNGNAITAGLTVDLVACTVQWSVPAGADLDLSQFAWEGEGFELGSLTYNNGLDIIRDVLELQGNLSYGATTYDTTEWTSQTLANTEAMGISLQTDRGLVEQLIEPITVSLQGIVDILGDGRLTFIPRDPDAGVTGNVSQHEIIGEPRIEIEADEVVSNIVIEYGRSAVDRDDVLTLRYDAVESQVTSAYGILRTEPIGAVQTALTVESDALALAEEIAATSSDPQTIVEVTTRLTLEVFQLFQIIQVDIGRPQRPDVRVFEILGRTLSLEDGELLVNLTLRELPDRQPIDLLLLLAEDYEALLTEGFATLLLE